MTVFHYVGTGGAVYQYDTDQLQFHEIAEILALP